MVRAVTVTRIDGGVRIETEDHELVIERGPVPGRVEVSVFTSSDAKPPAGGAVTFSIPENTWAFAMGALLLELGIKVGSDTSA